jgi:hypothetical protein
MKYKKSRGVSVRMLVPVLLLLFLIVMVGAVVYQKNLSNRSSAREKEFCSGAGSTCLGSCLTEKTVCNQDCSSQNQGSAACKASCNDEKNKCKSTCRELVSHGTEGINLNECNINCNTEASSCNQECSNYGAAACKNECSQGYNSCKAGCK